MSAEARHHYPTTLSDEQWALIEPLLPEPKSGPGQPGRPVVDRRRLLDAILYVVKSGCQWRMLPSDLGAWSTAYRYRAAAASTPGVGRRSGRGSWKS